MSLWNFNTISYRNLYRLLLQHFVSKRHHLHWHPISSTQTIRYSTFITYKVQSSETFLTARKYRRSTHATLPPFADVRTRCCEFFLVDTSITGDKSIRSDIRSNDRHDRRRLNCWVAHKRLLFLFSPHYDHCVQSLRKDIQYLISLNVPIESLKHSTLDNEYCRWSRRRRFGESTFQVHSIFLERWNTHERQRRCRGGLYFTTIPREVR